jgi:hypothetical protein
MNTRDRVYPNMALISQSGINPNFILVTPPAIGRFR